MAIARDSVSAGSVSFGAATNFWTHTCTGANRLLVVGAFDDAGGASLITGITYNGAAFAKVASVLPPGDRWVTLWMLANPDTGANTITITTGGAIVSASAISYTGAKQTGLPDAFGTGTTPSGASVSTTLTVGANAWIVSTIKNGGGAPTWTNATGQAVTVHDGGAMADSDAALTGAQTTTASGGTRAWGIASASFLPAGAGGGGGAAVLKPLLVFP